MVTKYGYSWPKALQSGEVVLLNTFDLKCLGADTIQK